MMISPIGNSYGYYTAGYASSATTSAARTAMADSLHADSTSILPVDDVPEVFSNDETERVPRTPEEMANDRRSAYEVMTSLTPRNAEALNAPLQFLPKPPFSDTSGDTPTDEVTAEESLGQPEKVEESEECETCKNRTYVDGSNENDVSFKSPGHIAPEASAAVVSAHEYQHVANAVQEGNKPNAELVSATVSLKTAICPECGKTYVAGGETRTTMRYQKENPYKQTQEAFQNFLDKRNESVDMVA